ncbi:PIN domain-containing protein [Halomonas ramblicola]|uniref:PIN domain-containing protein n=1 Tax=Halomonas ramblicola TaxID=747349 RepID=UPI0025B33428|nr:PIN domain-containing protein [Halomonas ramblicola]MDN3521862.1 PIN domain-containing protein [Halomonas ramblicola]
MSINIFIDTNIFLSFYHLSDDDLEEIRKLSVLLERDEVRLWLPQQVKDEFFRNRENKVHDAIKRLKDQNKKASFPVFCKSYPEFNEIRELQNNFNSKMKDLVSGLESDIRERKLEADEVIGELFRNSKELPISDEVVSKARFRVDVGNPPGKNGSLGDAINWEVLLSQVPMGEELYLIADDKDYYSVLDENSLKDFLIDEWSETNKSDVIFYRRLSQFFKDHYPDIRMASELEKELDIKSLRESSNFAATHSTIARLSSYGDFSYSQVNELSRILVNNEQVSWIVCDSDVNGFYADLVNKYREQIETEYLQEVEAHLWSCVDE